MVRTSWWLSGMLLLFIVPFISGLWSSNLSNWWTIIQDKLPLLFFPFIIPAFQHVNEEWGDELCWILSGITMLTIIYSIGMYVMDANGAAKYLQAKVMKVSMKGDHVRYAWLLLINLLWMIHRYFIQPSTAQQRMVAGIFIGIVSIFIHLLAAKTGLVGWYLLMFLWILFSVKGIKKAAFVLAIMTLPIVAWFSIPSFQNRLRFIWWDFQHYTQNAYVEGLSDTPRIYSLKGGAAILQQHYALGVGAGDVKDAIVQWYTEHAPFLKDYEQLLPSNEIMLYGCVGGVLSILVISLMIFLPLFQRSRRSFLWLGFHALFCMISMYEISLETQYGVFLYAFFGSLFLVSHPIESTKRA